jgi:hypothetical protein
MRLAAAHGIDAALLRRIAVISAGTLDSLPAEQRRSDRARGVRFDPPRELFRHSPGPQQ